ncbi:hypothetical protein BS47DRAFT_1344194 [Hydnum rufescens UP504]|uniref:HNH nuclease domain-containing protein n=1 Tax=Hydnum rufescens UP504 TaxID=1448309 RepID=A0A9P6AWP3_9AGAM|nr:hypothetical protein BS47DRAFT_1344194 [Hydnum rufescens UP504]
MSTSSSLQPPPPDPDGHSMSPLPSPELLQPVPQGYVRLLLLPKKGFYLEIPIPCIQSLCLRPLKYLTFLAWSILGQEGTLAAPHTPEPIPFQDLTGNLVDGGIYSYILTSALADAEDLSRAVDLEVIKYKSAVTSQTNTTRDDFRTRLLERDGFCVFTGYADGFTEAVHIIPFSRWFEALVRSRRAYDESVDDLTDINDVRNGLHLVSLLPRSFDQRGVVILKTPNLYLDVADVPPRAQRDEPFDPSLSYPPNDRYSLQWLVDPGRGGRAVPSNLDAAFKTQSQQPPPSALLLHYIYGAAAITQWGHGSEVLKTHQHPARPKAPEPAPMGPKRSNHNRTIATQKHDAAQNQNQHHASKPTSDKEQTDGPDRTVDSEHNRQWLVEDLVYRLWLNAPDAKEYRRKEKEEKDNNVDRWRRGIS